MTELGAGRGCSRLWCSRIKENRLSFRNWAKEGSDNKTMACGSKSAGDRFFTVASISPV